jgi:hypothetical protein
MAYNKVVDLFFKRRKYGGLRWTTFVCSLP